MEFGTGFKVLAETGLPLKNWAPGRLKKINIKKLRESLLGRNSLKESLLRGCPGVPGGGGAEGEGAGNLSGANRDVAPVLIA